MESFEITAAEERRIIEDAHRVCFAILKEKDPEGGAVGFEPWDIPEIQFKRTPRNYTHLKCNGPRLLTCEDYLHPGGAYNIEAITRTLGQHLANERLIAYYKFMAQYGPNAK